MADPGWPCMDATLTNIQVSATGGPDLNGRAFNKYSSERPWRP